MSDHHLLEITKVLPESFRGDALLEISGQDDMLVTALSQQIDAQLVETVDSNQELSHPGRVFDLTVFSGVLARVEDPTKLLRTSSEFSRFALISEVLSEEKFLQRDAMRAIILDGGFDILAEHVTKPDERSAYLAVLKSRNVEVLSPEKVQAVHEVLSEEFGADNIVSTGIFGSTTRATEKRNSDYDYTVIVKDLPADVYVREAACPRIKQRLREAGIHELCAFNLYTPEEFEMANTQKLWLIESMKTGYRVLHDTDDYLENILGAQQPGVERVGTAFAWQGVEYVEETRFQHVIERQERVVELLQASDPEIADYHQREAERIKLIALLSTHGESASRASISELTKRLNSCYGEQLDTATYLELEFLQETAGKRAMYGYGTVDRHLDAAAILEANGLPLDALSHTVVALRNIYLKVLHAQDSYIIDGEVTQLFMREFGGRLPAELKTSIYQNSFKAEQILGRSGFLSFDMDEKGNPLYENPNEQRFDYKAMTSTLRKIIEDLRQNEAIQEMLVPQSEPTVSVIVVSGDGSVDQAACLQAIDSLIMPAGKVETLVTKDVNEAVSRSRGEYVALVDEAMLVSPLWLVNLLAGFKDDTVAAVGGSAALLPESKRVAPKQTRDILGQPLTLLSGGACIKKSVANTVGIIANPFADHQKLIAYDPVLIASIRNTGSSIGIVDGESAYL